MALSSANKQLLDRGAPFAEEFGQRVRAARLAQGLSQASLGRPLTRAYVSLVESGRVLPSLPALLHLARRLGVDPCWLLGYQQDGLLGYTGGHAHDTPRRPTAG